MDRSILYCMNKHCAKRESCKRFLDNYSEKEIEEMGSYSYYEDGSKCSLDKKNCDQYLNIFTAAGSGAMKSFSAMECAFKNALNNFCIKDGKLYQLVSSYKISGGKYQPKEYSWLLVPNFDELNLAAQEIPFVEDFESWYNELK